MTGLESNGYYINNDIIVKLPAVAGNEYFTIRVEDIGDANNAFVSRLYASPDGTAEFNLSPIVKSLMQFRRTATFRIRRTLSSNNASFTLTKTFLRGGNRTSKTNQVSGIDLFLNPDEKFAVFRGLPITFDYLNSDYTISQIPQQDVPNSILDFKETKGCNGIYIKFLNQSGGYSYWFFRSHTDSESATNLGGFTVDSQPNDLGNEVNNTLKVWGKFPEEYKNTAKDLVVSGEIYIYQEGEFVRVRNSKNTIDTDEIKRAYAVTLRFELDNRFNPSLLWQN